MTSIHRTGLSSLLAARRATTSNAHRRTATRWHARNDELELVVAASQLGFCVLDSETPQLRANSQFKSRIWLGAHCAPIGQGLLERVEVRTAASTLPTRRARALGSGVDLDLAVQATWPDGTEHWVALHGRTTNDGHNNRT